MVLRSCIFSERNPSFSSFKKVRLCLHHQPKRRERPFGDKGADTSHPDLIVRQQPERLRLHYQPKRRERPFGDKGADTSHPDLIVCQQPECLCLHHQPKRRELSFLTIMKHEFPKTSVFFLNLGYFFNNAIICYRLKRPRFKRKAHTLYATHKLCFLTIMKHEFPKTSVFFKSGLLF